MIADKITLCLTMGRRPDLLRQTLQSLKGLPPMAVLAINDFGDEETNAVFREMCPHGRLIDAGRHLGHHGAVDLMYAEVKTPYIFHCEDDWGFTRTDFLEDAVRLLHTDPLISVVCLRASGDIPLSDADRKLVQNETRDGIALQRMEAVHPQWHGFSFNPHLAEKRLWEELGGFSQFEKERYVSRFLRAKGRYVAFLLPEACRHIGDNRSNTPGRDSLFRRVKKWLRGIKSVS
ncbi:glycosyltransferase [Xinfangfangia sp. D13-10-4-6]|uniref:glycosyltransferase n=1 Tax=Pseudogemmobacter hezensis TaxID=2737662 RepID=UPI0015547939|nr:glycosyltransferase [Pseudogemmobacter hezensis]NPD14806.1 glycosyltransferase [Pseudogemmobacter hezensis]